jgi:hypothetical protein
LLFFQSEEPDPQRTKGRRTPRNKEIFAVLAGFAVHLFSLRFDLWFWENHGEENAHEKLSQSM